MNPEEIEKELFKKWNDKMAEIKRDIEIAVDKVEQLYNDPGTWQNKDFDFFEEDFILERNFNVELAFLNVFELRLTQQYLHVSMKLYKNQKALGIIDNLLLSTEDEEPDNKKNENN